MLALIYVASVVAFTVHMIIYHAADRIRHAKHLKWSAEEGGIGTRKILVDRPDPLGEVVKNWLSFLAWPLLSPVAVILIMMSVMFFIDEKLEARKKRAQEEKAAA